MSNYHWALNKIKLQRAIVASKSKTEDDIMDIYKKIGGAVDKRQIEVKGEIIIQTPEEEVSCETGICETPCEEEKPKKKIVRRKKNV